MRSTEYATLSVTFCARTLHAVMVDAPELPAPVWIPRSAVHWYSQKIVNAGTRGDIVELRIEVPMAKQKGLI